MDKDMKRCGIEKEDLNRGIEKITRNQDELVGQKEKVRGGEGE